MTIFPAALPPRPEWILPLLAAAAVAVAARGVWVVFFRRRRRGARSRAMGLFTALCLLLCVGVLAAWEKSLRRSYTLSWVWYDPLQSLYTSSGVMVSYGEVVWSDRWWKPPAGRFAPPEPTGMRYEEDLAWRMPVNRLGFAWAQTTMPGNLGADEWLAAPLWLLAAAAGAAPLLVRGVGALRRRKRRQAGLCRGCGYDLRATPGRCPECGREAAAGAEGAGVGLARIVTGVTK